jgi:hypothetical protein
MENRRMEDKIDKLHENITEILVVLERNTASLDYHIKRTDMLEAKVEHVDKHVKMVNGAMKLIGVLATIVGIYAAVKGK